MVINILNICNNIMKSLKKFDNNINVQNYIESHIIKKPNVENPDKKDIIYHRAGDREIYAYYGS